MANETYLPGSILSMPAAVADRLITAGNGDAALLYLHLLSTGGVYDEKAARRLKWDPPRCDAAHALLVGMGLALPGQAAPAAPIPAPEPSKSPPPTASTMSAIWVKFTVAYSRISI